MLAPLGPGPESDVKAARGLEERLRDAVAREQEFTHETTPEVDRQRGKSRNARRRCSRTDHLDRRQCNVKSTAAHTNRIEFGVMLALLTGVAHTACNVKLI